MYMYYNICNICKGTITIANRKFVEFRIRKIFEFRGIVSTVATLNYVPPDQAFFIYIIYT